MPVRKIPKNYIGVTGAFASLKNGRMLGFESLLERDLMILLEFDGQVEGFEEQPITVPISELGKRPSKYVPDLLVQYKASTKPKKPRRPLLAEIKHTSDLAKHAAKYQPKFEAARNFAEDRDWEFRIINETEIRGPYLQNLKFLREYVKIAPSEADVAYLLGGLAELDGQSGLEDFLTHVCPSPERRLALLPVLWHLVVTGRVRTDLSVPLTGDTVLFLP